MHSKLVKILLSLNILNPKYTLIIFNKIRFFLYYKFGNNKKLTYEKLNTRLCKSFYKYFKINDNFYNIDNTSIIPLSNVVFLFWYDGLDSMPKLVKTCYYNLLKTTRYKVILIDKNNIKMYSNISNDIYNLVKNNIISMTLFSDILRLNLLSIHNAIWLDSTCFLYRDFPKDIFNTKFLTIYPPKNKSIFDNIPKFYYAPDLHLQQSYFLVGTDKYIFKKWYNLLTTYILNETTTLRHFRPYYLMYFIFEYLYSTDEKIRLDANNREINNDLVETIEGHNDSTYVDSDFNKYFNNTTFLYKLSYKMKFEPYIDGVLTPYGKLLQLKGMDING